METSFIVISAILVALISVPFLLINAMGKSDTRKLRSHFKKIAIKHNLTPTAKEGWGNSFIGIDEAQMKMIFLKINGTDVREEIVNLYPVKGCEVRETTEVIRANHSRETILVRVALIISFGNGQEPLDLIFYDRESGYQEDYEHDRADRWKKMITAALAIQSTPRKVA